MPEPIIIDSQDSWPLTILLKDLRIDPKLLKAEGKETEEGTEIRISLKDFPPGPSPPIAIN